MKLAEGWDALGLDARVRRAASKRGFSAPTAVQAAVVGALSRGADALAVARTGTGKTAAYLLPALDLALREADGGGAGARPLVVVVVPTTELVGQVKAEAKALCAAAGASCSAGALPPPSAPAAALRAACAAAPNILVATPARLAGALRQGLLVGFSPRLVVLDEADLLLSYGYADDLAAVFERVPSAAQRIMLSATAGADVEELKKLALTEPEVLEVEAVGSADSPTGHDQVDTADATPTAPAEALPSTIEHFLLRVASKDDKLLAAMAMLRSGAARKKTITFVTGADASVRLRLFLERFGVASAAVHAELPLNSREHTLQSFNRGVFDHLVATDTGPSKSKKLEAGVSAGAMDHVDRGDGTGAKPKKQRKRDAEFGVVRGVDFKDVRTVVNLGVPSTAEQYIHRVGRTGRAGKKGVAITLVAPGEEVAFERMVAEVNARCGAAGGIQVRPFSRLGRDTLEALRYRAEDVLRGIGKTAVREARVRELRTELLNSERLQAHFEANPVDRVLLQHDAPLSKRPSAPHLKRIPAYLKGGKTVAAAGRPAKRQKRSAHAPSFAQEGDGGGEDGDGAVNAADPLHSFVLSSTVLDDAADAGSIKARKRAERRLARMGTNASSGGSAAANWTKGPARQSNVRKNKRKTAR